MPHFSVIMPALDVAEYIGEAIDSVINQSFTDWELIVVDDGSTDATYDIAQEKAASDSRILVLREERPRRRLARLTAAANARAPLLARMDSDDVMESDYLESVARFMEANPGYDIYSCNVLVFGSDCAARPFFTGDEARGPRSTTLDEMLVEDRIFPMAVLGREIYESVGGFREAAYREDYDFWLRAMVRGARHIYNPQIIARYRQRPGQLTGDKLKMRESYFEILENLLGEPALTECHRRFIEARLGRERMQKNMAAGDFRHARRDYWRCRTGYVARAKYWLSWPLVMVSPRLFWRLFDFKRNR